MNETVISVAPRPSAIAATEAAPPAIAPGLGEALRREEKAAEEANRRRAAELARLGAVRSQD